MRIYEKFNLFRYNAYRLNAFCRKAYFPESEKDIVQLYCDQNQLIVIGNGNNIILSREWYDESFILFNDCFDKVDIKGTEISAEAGATLLQLSELAMQNALSGFEIFYDIPSSVGGAVVMNAGASSKEIKDLIIKVRYLDLADGKIKELPCEAIEFEYRNSFFQKNKDKLVLKVWFNLIPGTQTTIKANMEETKEKRWAKQPREYPNCGSVFKRPKGHFVGPMLDELGLKGFAIGGAKISEKHSGFIVNTGNATGKDILSLIEVAKVKVRERFNIDLEIEQKII